MSAITIATTNETTETVLESSVLNSLYQKIVSTRHLLDQHRVNASATSSSSDSSVALDRNSIRKLRQQIIGTTELIGKQTAKFGLTIPLVLETRHDSTNANGSSTSSSSSSLALEQLCDAFFKPLNALASLTLLFQSSTSVISALQKDVHQTTDRILKVAANLVTVADKVKPEELQDTNRSPLTLASGQLLDAIKRANKLPKGNVQATRRYMQQTWAVINDTRLEYITALERHRTISMESSNSSSSLSNSSSSSLCGSEFADESAIANSMEIDDDDMVFSNENEVKKIEAWMTRFGASMLILQQLSNLLKLSKKNQESSSSSSESSSHDILRDFNDLISVENLNIMVNSVRQMEKSVVDIAYLLYPPHDDTEIMEKQLPIHALQWGMEMKSLIIFFLGEEETNHYIEDNGAMKMENISNGIESRSGSEEGKEIGRAHV